MAEAARKFSVAETPLHREAPNNIEAEQALLGAILVNNDAFYRVSDFLKAQHFYEPLHRRIFEVASELIRMGKIATPITLSGLTAIILSLILPTGSAEPAVTVEPVDAA